MADSYSTQNKALVVNQDPQRYGTFAEIGAGQEVARHFFIAGLASKTIAKTMSAYDMQFSDSIYGRESDGRYVCESRLNKMLVQEYQLLSDRLGSLRADSTAFFAFADTVTTSSKSDRSHGFMGVKFQRHPKDEPSEIMLHVWMKDAYRLDQQEALGILGVNLIFGAMYLWEDPKSLISTLVENLKPGRIDIDLIRFSGPAFSKVDNRLMSLELVRQGLTHLVMFDGKGNVALPSDTVYQKAAFIQRGTFRPVTKINMLLLENGLKEFKKSLHQAQKTNETISLCELNMSQLFVDGVLDERDFLDRVDLLNALNLPVLVSDYHYFFELKEHLRRLTREPIGMVMGAALLDKIFNPEAYEKAPLKGGFVAAMARLLDDQTQLFIYPFKTATTCMTSQTVFFSEPTQTLYRYWQQRGVFVDIQDCEATESSILSETVRDYVANQNPQWKQWVPEAVVDLIIERKLFQRRP